MRVDIKLEGLKELKNVTNKDLYFKAEARTIREAGRKFRTTTVKAVRKTYNVKASELKKRMKIGNSKDSYKYEWHMYVKGRPLGLENFGARQTKKGVSVLIKRQSGRKVLLHTFLRRGKSGNLKVFARKGKERLPIKSYYTISIPQMFTKEIVDAGLERVEREYKRDFERNLLYYITKK